MSKNPVELRIALFPDGSKWINAEQLIRWVRWESKDVETEGERLLFGCFADLIEGMCDRGMKSPNRVECELSTLADDVH